MAFFTKKNNKQGGMMMKGVSKTMMMMMITTIMMMTMLSLTTAKCASIVDLIKSLPELSKAYEWANQTDLLDSLDIGQYGDKVTLILPSNSAFRRFEINFPERKNALLSNNEDLETLMLFASADHDITFGEIRSGKYEDDESIVSLLSEYSSIDSDGELCISDVYRTCDSDNPCCTSIDMSAELKADDGRILLIDDVVLPGELITRFEDDLGI